MHARYHLPRSRMHAALAEATPQRPRAARSPAAGSGLPSLLRRAQAEPSHPLDAPVQDALAPRIPFDFASVRVHAGADSARAADRLGARAFTIGGDVHLGAEVRNLAAVERTRLLAHEAVHAAQQGGGRATLQGSLEVSQPHDAAEIEAGRISEAVMSPAGAPVGGSFHVSRFPAQIHRDLRGAYDLDEGRFRIDMTTESHPGAKNGMSGTLSFRPNDAAPDAGNIRLLQIARDENLVTGGEYTWTGGEANRNSMMTTADAGRMITGGFFVDHLAASATPRTARADPRVSPFYRDYAPNATESHDGWKHGTNIRSASLWDYPGSSSNRRFSFETFAVAASRGGSRPGHVYGAVKWGFTISDASTGTVDNERVTYHNRPSSNYYAALRAFNEFYSNPGSSTAP